MSTETEAASVRRNHEDHTLDALKGAVAYIEFDPDGTIRWANRLFLGAVGYELDEVEGKHHRMFVFDAERDQPSYERFWRELGKGQVFDGVVRRRRSDGTELWVRVNYVPVKGHGGKVEKVFKTCWDVTAEHKKRVENDRLSFALEVTPAPVMLADDQLNIIYMNTSMRELIHNAEGDIRKQLPNFDARNLIGQNIDGFHKRPSHQRSVLSNMRDPMSTTLVIGGRSFYLRIAPVDHAEQGRLGFVVNWTDRTAEVYAEEQVQAVVQAAAQGDLGSRIEVSGFDGFMKRLGAGINSLMDTVVDPVRETIEVSRQLAEGNLAVSIRGDHQGEFNDLKTSVNGFVEQLNQMIGRCKTIIEEVAVASNQVRDSSQEVSSSAERQSEAVQGSSASLTETASMVKANAENAGIANDLVSETSDAAKTGNDRMSEMMSAMEAIEQSSSDIAKIIKVIDEIAFQTNLLALNAAVEAARAGKYGKGFAVVAQEVRTLAERSAKAAKETAEIIENSRVKVTEGASLSKATSESLGAIVENVMKVRDLVAEITAASDEQSRGVTNITEAMEDIAQGTESSNHQASSLAAAATEMSRQTEVLRSELGRFRLAETSSAGGDFDLSSLSPEMVAKLMSMLQSGGAAPKAAAPKAPPSRSSAPRASAGGASAGGAPGDVFPMDQDERGFDGF